MTRPRVLLLSRSAPWPPVKGDAQRTNLLYRALAQVAEVDLLLIEHRLPASELQVLRDDFRMLECLAPADYWRKIRWLHATKLVPGARSAIKPFLANPAFRERLRRALADTDYAAIVCRYLPTLAKFDALSLPGRPPVLVDIDDMDHRQVASEAALVSGWRKFEYTIRYQITRSAVLRLVRQADHAWITRSSDISELPEETRSHSILANIPFRDHQPGPTSAKARGDSILFVGTMQWYVNVRAIDHFIRHVWPQIRRTCGTAELRIVGSGPRPVAAASWDAQDGVNFIGFVEDLAGEYARSLFSIVPIREGAGTKIKVLECFAFKRTCVTTRHSLTGYEHALEHEKALLVADSDAEFSAQCIRLLQDPVLRDGLAEAGERKVAENFSFDSFSSQVHADMQKYLSRERPK